MTAQELKEAAPHGWKAYIAETKMGRNPHTFEFFAEDDEAAKRHMDKAASEYEVETGRKLKVLSISEA